MRFYDRLSHYAIEEQINSLGNYTAHKARYIVNEAPCLIKEFSTPNDLDLFIKAYQKGALRHPAILPIYEVFIEEDKGYIVSQYLGSKSMHELLPRLSFLDIVRIFYDVCMAAGFTHDQNIPLGNIKYDRILLQRDLSGYKAYLIDCCLQEARTIRRDLQDLGQCLTILSGNSSATEFDLEKEMGKNPNFSYVQKQINNIISTAALASATMQDIAKILLDIQETLTLYTTAEKNLFSLSKLTLMQPPVKAVTFPGAYDAFYSSQDKIFMTKIAPNYIDVDIVDTTTYRIQQKNNLPLDTIRDQYSDYRVVDICTKSDQVVVAIEAELPDSYESHIILYQLSSGRVLFLFTALSSEYLKSQKQYFHCFNTSDYAGFSDEYFVYIDPNGRFTVQDITSSAQTQAIAKIADKLHPSQEVHYHIFEFSDKFLFTKTINTKEKQVMHPAQTSFYLFNNSFQPIGKVKQNFSYLISNIKANQSNSQIYIQPQGEQHQLHTVAIKYQNQTMELSIMRLESLYDRLSVLENIFPPQYLTISPLGQWVIVKCRDIRKDTFLYYLMDRNTPHQDRIESLSSRVTPIFTRDNLHLIFQTSAHGAVLYNVPSSGGTEGENDAIHFWK